MIPMITSMQMLTPTVAAMPKLICKKDRTPTSAAVVMRTRLPRKKARAAWYASDEQPLVSLMAAWNKTAVAAEMEVMDAANDRAQSRRNVCCPPDPSTGLSSGE